MSVKQKIRAHTVNKRRALEGGCRISFRSFVSYVSMSGTERVLPQDTAERRLRREDDAGAEYVWGSENKNKNDEDENETGELFCSCPP